ncbi:MAG: efflux RND transporter periplasmic adaptor subunit [Deltaproteobacteria bacterium]|nr:efflux RND transporter periplasmic adaptor subunit [Deltaproteobacteria bacterium]
MKWFLQRLGVGLLLLALIAPTGGCRDSESRAEPGKVQDSVKVIKVDVVEVTPEPIRDVLVLPGETEAWQDIVVAADKNGRVEWIGPREGQVVEKGELLARIDVSSLKTIIKKSEASAELTKDLYDRRKTLFDRGIVHKEALDRARTDKALAESDLVKAKVEYDRGFPHSPISGMVNYLHVDEGEFVNRGQPMVELVNVDKIKIHVNVPELDVRYLKKGQDVMVTIDALSDLRLKGTVDFVSYKADPATKTFRVRVLIDNPQHAIRPGMIARVAFLKRMIPDALSAPLFAILDKGGERLLFVEKNGVAHARTISIGVIAGDRVQITDGLKPGDHLIVTGQRDVEEGMKVQVQ